MRRVLVLGGTGWLGREVAAAAVAKGAEVFCLARGETGAVATGTRLVRADRLAPGAYDGAPGEWDEVIELACDPALVEPALEALSRRAAHWTLVSSVSVYARNDQPHADESASLVEPRDLSRYADAKVAAERTSAGHLGDRLLIARPGLIAGPGDPSDRFGYWPARLHVGGPTLAPEPANRFVQVIDVGDLATWIELVGREGIVGRINAVGEIHPMADFFHSARIVADFEGAFVSPSDEILLGHGVGYWAGPRSLPLWVPESDAGFAQRAGGAFLATGGLLRPLEETLTRTLADEIERGVGRPRRAGLTSTEEASIRESIARGR